MTSNPHDPLDILSTPSPTVQAQPLTTTGPPATIATPTGQSRGPFQSPTQNVTTQCGSHAETGLRTPHISTGTTINTLNSSMGNVVVHTNQTSTLYGIVVPHVGGVL